MRAPWLDDGDVRVYQGDCVEVMREMDAASVDAVVCDPPYGLGFMGKEWDSGKSFVERKPVRSNRFDHVGGNHNPTSPQDAARTRGVESVRFGEWCETWATEALRVLKPGGHLLAFGGTRTYHRLACAIEDAGFEVRDCLTWLYGSGFPKSLDVSKAIDRAAGAEREVVGERHVAVDQWTEGGRQAHARGETAIAVPITAPATLEAARWEGWGTALKPAWEPVVVARKPLAERTVAAQVLATGTGALNVDGCRVAGKVPSVPQPRFSRDMRAGFGASDGRNGEMSLAAGRWPANVALDEAAAGMLDAAVGERPSATSRSRPPHAATSYHLTDAGGTRPCEYAGETGGPSRFFYTAKAGREEREGSKHPTVKPVALMRWLVRLVTPPGGLVLDPFAGSGTTLQAARAEGFRAVGIEREDDYLPDIARRLRQLSLFGDAA